MKITLTFILTILISGFSLATSVDLRHFDYTRADSIALSLNRKFSSTEKLAEKLTNDLSTEHEKFRSIFRWVADNIEYSYSQRSTEPKYVLKKRAAVCSGYSNLLKELCDISGIECEVINGYAKSFENKDIGKFDKTTHAWNAVKLNNEWYLVDATWAAGYVTGRRFTKEFNNFYYLTDPDIFIYRHLPEDSKWTFSTKEISLKEFGKMPIYKDEFFNLGIIEIEPIDGQIKNRLRYKFQSDQLVTRISYYFERERKFHEVGFTENDNIYEFEIEFEKTQSGQLLLYVNRECILGLLKK
jgi:hypothetical protein